MSGVGWRDGVHATQSRGVLGQCTVLGVVLVDVMCTIFCIFGVRCWRKLEQLSRGHIKRVKSSWTSI